MESTICGAFRIIMYSIRRFICERAAKKHRLPVRIGSIPPPSNLIHEKPLNPTPRNEREMKGGSIVAVLAEGGGSSGASSSFYLCLFHDQIIRKY
jgi:hypothetical protein